MAQPQSPQQQQLQQQQQNGVGDSVRMKQNLAVLQRNDPHVLSILDTTAHVAVYIYDKDKGWDREEIEGALFVVKRDVEPWYQLVVLNRLSIDNMIQAVDAQFQLQQSDPFLIFQNAVEEIHGIWFYNASERERIGALIDELIKECKEREASPQQAEEEDAKENNSQEEEGGDDNIMRFFTAGGGAPPPPQPQMHPHLPSRGMAPHPLFALPPHAHPQGIPHPGGPFGQPRPGMHPFPPPHPGAPHPGANMGFPPGAIPPHGAVLPGLKANPPHSVPLGETHGPPFGAPHPHPGNFPPAARRAAAEGEPANQGPPSAQALLQLLQRSREGGQQLPAVSSPLSEPSPSSRRFSSTPTPISFSHPTSGLLPPSAILARSLGSSSPSSAPSSLSGSSSSLRNLASSSSSTNVAAPVSRSEFQQVLQRMLQDDRFIDIFYQEFLFHHRRLMTSPAGIGSTGSGSSSGVLGAGSTGSSGGVPIASSPTPSSASS